MDSLEGRNLKSYIGIIRPLNGVMCSLAVYAASVIAGLSFYPDISVIIAMLSAFFVCAGGMVINDYFDADVDRLNKPERALPSGKMSMRAALAYAVVLFAAGIAGSFLINIYAFATTTAASAMLVLHAWRLKKSMLLGNLLASFLVGLTFIYGGLINLNYASTAILAFLAFLINTSLEIYKSIEDIMGDKKHGLASLAAKYGVNKARTIGASFLLFALVMSFVPFGLGMFGYVYLMFALIADLLFLFAILFQTKASKIIKFGMLVAVVSFLAGIMASA